MIVVLFAPLYHYDLRLVLSLVYQEMHRAVLRAYPRHLSWLLGIFFICAVKAKHHGRHFFFFKHLYFYSIVGVPPEDLIFVRNFLFSATDLLVERFGTEIFWRGIDRARLWLWLLGLALFVHLLAFAFFLDLPVLDLLSVFFVRHLFPAVDSPKHFLTRLVDLCLFLARFSILRSKLDSSSRIACGRIGSKEVYFCFLICSETHAWALYSGMKGLTNIFYPQILLLEVTRGEKLFFACRLVTVDATAIQLVKNMR